MPDLSHQAWCDADLHKNKNNKDSKSQHFEKFAAEVEQLEASMADLTEPFAAVPSNLEVSAKIEVDETAVRKEHGHLNAQTVPGTQLHESRRSRRQFCARGRVSLSIILI